MRAKKIYPIAIIFDFDDTLIKDTAKSHLYRDGKFIKSMDANEYHHYIKKPNETFDFSEFDYPKKIIASKGPIWNLFQKYYNSKYPLYILTARRDTAKVAIYKFLLDNNIHFLFDHIYCVGGPDISSSQIPAKKKEALLKYIKPLYNKVIFYEDNDLTVNRLRGLSGIYPILINNI